MNDRGLLKHLGDGGFKLEVPAAENGGGIIVDEDVRFYLEILKVGVVLGAPVANLRDAEHYEGVDLVFPPDGGHGAGNRGADQFSNAQGFVGVGCSRCV